MSAIINVDKKKREDPHYRYKMPALDCKVESGGNGVKVVFSNLGDVSSALSRPPEALLKWLGVSKGTQSTFDVKDNKFYIMGNYLTTELQDTVFDFIERFVLCKHCRNPETQVIAPQKKAAYLHCASCGKDTGLEAQDDKIVRELAKGSGHTKSETAKATAAAGAAALISTEGDIPTVLDLTLEYALPGEGAASKDPTLSLAEALKDLKTIGKVGVQKRLISIKSEHGINDEGLPRLIFRGATSAAISANQPFIGPLRDACFLFKNQLDSNRSQAAKASEIQDIIISEVCLRVINLGKTAKVPMVLKMLIDESVLEPLKVIEFCNNLATAPHPAIKKKDQLPELIEQLQCLVKWLEEGQPKAEEKPAEGAEDEAAAAAAAAPTKSKK